MTAFPSRIPHASRLLVLATACLMSPVSALEYQCSLPGDTRFIRVDIPAEDYLCEVAVTYQSSGERRVMWYAQNSTAYCFDKAEELVARYTEEWQFDCNLWPDHDGVAQLDETQKIAFDRDLLALRDSQTQAPPHAARAVSSDDGNHLAIQYFFETDDLVRLMSRTSGRWQRIAEYRNLGSHVIADVPIGAALITDIADNATLSVVTTVSPLDRQGASCRGVQELTPAGDTSSLNALSPHRFSCDPA